jgi:hypothetical protein
MGTVLEECSTEEQRSVVPFLWAKGLKAKDIHKEMFPLYGGKCLSPKAVRNWGEKHGKPFADDEEVKTEMRKWLRQQSKDCCRFRRTGKSDRTNVEDMSRNISFCLEYHVFYVLYSFVICINTRR